MSVIKVDNNSFNEILKNEFVLVDFFANWCGPCKMLSPIIEELSNEIDNVVFAKINIDESSGIASSYGIMSIPTLILFKNGKMVNKSVGFISKDELKRFIADNK